MAPTTGFVHVRKGAQLQNNQILSVSATDQNGEGLTGEIELIVSITTTYVTLIHEKFPSLAYFL